MSSSIFLFSFHFHVPSLSSLLASSLFIFPVFIFSVFTFPFLPSYPPTLPLRRIPKCTYTPIPRAREDQNLNVEMSARSNASFTTPFLSHRYPAQKRKEVRKRKKTDIKTSVTNFQYGGIYKWPFGEKAVAAVCSFVGTGDVVQRCH